MRDLKRFRTHVEILKHSHPDVVIQLVSDPKDNPAEITGESPDYVLKWMGKSLQSAKSPAGEAKKLLEKVKFESGRAYLVFGMGLGHLVEEARGRLADRSELIVVEPEIRILREVLGCADLRPLLFDNRVRWVSGKDWRNRLWSILRQAQDAGARPSTTILNLPAYRTYFGRELGEARGILAQFLNERNIDTSTRKILWDLWNRNLAENLDAILTSAPVRSFTDTFKGIPAVLVGAGPSLDDNLGEMEKLKEKVLLIAVDTALASLLSVGCEPDLVLAMDAQEENALDFKGLDTQGMKTTLLFDAFCYPSIVKMYPAERRIASMTCHVIADIESTEVIQNGFLPLMEYLMGDRMGFLQNGGSVVTGGFDLTRLGGCSAVGLVGVDLAYPNFQSHSKLTMRSQEKFRQMNRTQTPETEFHSYLSEKAKVQVAGAQSQKSILSDRVMVMYKHWMEESAMMSGMSCFNLGKTRGALLQGYPALAVDDFVSRFGTSRPEIEERLLRCRGMRFPLNKKETSARLVELRKDIAALSTDPQICRVGPFDLDQFVQMASFEVAERLRDILQIEPESRHLVRRQQASRVISQTALKFLERFEKSLNETV